MLVGEQGKDLFVAVSAGFHSPTMPDYRLPIEGEPSGPGSSRPHIEYPNDPDRMGRGPRKSLFAREGFQTFVVVPLHARNKLVGVLEMYNRSTVDWGQDWLDFLAILGGIAGVAIDYAAFTSPLDAGGEGHIPTPRPSISDFEVEILRLIVEGFTNREISEHVHRSENTIKFHVRRILEKSGAANRTELARRATHEGWL